MKKHLILLSGFLFFFMPPLIAQEEIAVEQVIVSLFEGMKNKQEDLLRNAFHPDAIMQTVVFAESGSTIASNSVADFLNRVLNTPESTVLDERILDYQIKVDGHMASAWTPFEFYVNDVFSHCGVNSFQLIKAVEGWKIIYIIDTRRKNCGN
jgi:hypothetical protein